MKAVRCQNGHWYDSETYSQCPHCGQPGPAPVNHVQTEEKPGKKGFSLFKKNKTQAPAEPVPARNPVVKPAVKSEPSHSSTDDDMTERFFADIDDDKTVSMLEASDLTVCASVEEPAEQKTVAVAPTVEKRVTSEPLAAAVQRISAMDEGKTLSYFNAVTSSKESSDTASVGAKNAEPVVGWLVAISGPHLGDSFQLFVGKNTVGRNSGNRVVLSLDQSVSRESHAFIIYEPKRREFYLQSGNSDGLVYLNDTFMTGAQIMKAKDILEVGTTKMIFVPLCGADFSWEQYL